MLLNTVTLVFFFIFHQLNRLLIDKQKLIAAIQIAFLQLILSFRRTEIIVGAVLPLNFFLFNSVINTRVLALNWRQFLVDSWREEQRFVSVHRHIFHDHIENEVAAFAYAI